MSLLTENTYGFCDSLDSAMLVFQVPSKGLWPNIRRGNKHTTAQSSFFMLISYSSILLEMQKHYTLYGGIERSTLAVPGVAFPRLLSVQALSPGSETDRSPFYVTLSGRVSDGL